MQEMTITSVHALGPRYAVILKEKDADRYLPILVGASDANAIAIKLHNPQVSLNLTHDLLCTVIDALGGSVRQVLINALQDDILYSKITIQTSDSSHDIDCRPGDALALAVWTHVAILVDELVLNKAGVLLDKETGQVILASERPAEVTEEERRGMSAFTDHWLLGARGLLKVRNAVAYSVPPGYRRQTPPRRPNPSTSSGGALHRRHRPNPGRRAQASQEAAPHSPADLPATAGTSMGSAASTP